MNRKKQEASLASLDKVAGETKNPILKADVAVEKVMLGLHQTSLTSVHANMNGVDLPPMDPGFLRQCTDSLSAAIDIYAAFGVHERRLRAKACLAELLSFSGDDAAAAELFSDVARDSSRMNYANVQSSVSQPLSKIQAKLENRKAGLDADEDWAIKTDGELAEFAQLMLENVGLPQERLPNLLMDVKANQNISRERLEWCDQLLQIQDLTHTRSPETCYANQPKFWTVCCRFGFESIIGNGDSPAVTEAFKIAHCTSCKYRTPKRGNESA